MDIFVPDGAEWGDALKRTTHLGIGAHPDDLELMCSAAISACHGSDDLWFTGIVCTNGEGGPRAGRFVDLSPRDYVAQRESEQRAAAAIGKYSAVAMLGHGSSELRTEGRGGLRTEVTELVEQMQPSQVFTHNPFDHHETHLRVFDCVTAALIELRGSSLPGRYVGMEVWGSLDWLPLEQRVELECGSKALRSRLLDVFESQMEYRNFKAGVLGRQKANAAFSDEEWHKRASVDIGVDLLPLLQSNISVEDFVGSAARGFATSLFERLFQLRRTP